MTDTNILAVNEQDALTKALLAVAQRKGMTVADYALSAFVQNAVTQAALQALLNLVKRKNLVSREEIDRALAAAYHDARVDAETQGVVISPLQSPGRPGH